ncbi:MAG TPA: hypothetical protein VFQ06_01505 [Nitrospira sp.]|nr:hypothetical protein [Nitrospira sp.]
MSYAEIRNDIHHTISQIAQVQAWLRTIQTDIDMMHARMVITSQGSTNEQLLEGVARLSLARKEPERLVVLLQASKDNLYNYLEQHSA